MNTSSLPPVSLPRTLAAWGASEFDAVLKQEVAALAPAQLPLQAGLSQSSYVDEHVERDVVVLATRGTEAVITVRAGIFYGGVIAGSCCADDPTPVEAQTEYCEVEIAIDREDASARLRLLSA